MRKYFIPIILLASVMMAVAAYRVNDNDLFFLIKKNFTLFSEVYNEISLRYVDEVNPETIMRRGLNSMLQALDPYTVLFDEAQNQQMSILTTGKYAGVGIDVGSRGGRLVVLATTEGYSAHNKGVRAGDIIVEVNGFTIQDLSPEELEIQLLGEAGSKVTLVVERFGLDQQLTFELERERIEVKNLAYAGIIPGDQRIGYALISRFGQGTAAELREAIQKMLEEGPLDGFVLDMRNNPGGLLDEAVKTINKFVGPGVEVVKTIGRTPDTHFSYATDEPALLPDVPLVILQDGGSASASEIVAGAAQDLDRGVIIGERSFGKGLVQIIRPLSYDISMKITVSKYYIPSGRSIQAIQYVHSDSDFGANNILPDSLRRPFQTKAGRTVYDGAGIEPDIALSQRTPSMVEVALMQNSKYFFYATQSNREVPMGTAELPDAVFEDFLAWLEKDGFDFSTQSEIMIADLESSLANNGMAAQSRSQLQALRKLVNDKKDADLRANKQSVKQELHLELASKSGGPIERLKVRMSYDPLLKKATELLRDTAAYESILRPGN
jgi:carboxyl-terminal processing protease